MNFEKEIRFAENVAHPVSILAGLIIFLLHHRFGDSAPQTCRQSDQALAVFREQFVIDAGFVVKTFKETGGNKLDQIVVALKRLAEEHQMIRTTHPRFGLATLLSVAAVRFFAPVMPAAFGHVNLAADDGLDVPLAGLMEEIRSRKEVSVVCNGHGRHFLA